MKYVLALVISIYSFTWNQIFHTTGEFEKQEGIKNDAFRILQTKCNVCHSTKRKTEIFTFQNMDSLATDINQQVFIKRKMPKGQKFNLTEAEEKSLKNWINTVKN